MIVIFTGVSLINALLAPFKFISLLIIILSLKYSIELFDRELTERQKVRIDKRLEKIENHGYELFKNVISSQHPSFFFVINYEHFPEIMRELLAFFGDTELMKKRERPKSIEEILKETKTSE